MTEQEFWTLIEAGVPDLVLLDLGLGGSTTIGVDIAGISSSVIREYMC